MNNALSRALRTLERIERTLFTLQWLSDPALRQRSHAGLNKGEASNALCRAVFFHHQREFRDRTFEKQSYRASGLSLLRAVQQLRSQGAIIPDEPLAHVAPFGWEHTALTGNYDWNTARPAGGLRLLRAAPEAFMPRAAQRLSFEQTVRSPLLRRQTLPNRHKIS